MLAGSYQPRLILTPSYGRAIPSGNDNNFVLGHSHTELWTDILTLHIVVVRPFELRNYANALCPAGYVIASIPDNEESVGSARFWCVIIGHALKATWAFMLDDSLRKISPTCVPTYAPGRKLTFDQRTALFGVHEMEMVRTELEKRGKTKLVGVLAFPRSRGMDFSKKRGAVSLGNCQNFQYLHLENLRDKKVNFRRGLFKAEDMLFSQECCDKGIGSFQLNRVLHCKHTTITTEVKTSGAHSPTQACVPFADRKTGERKIEFDTPVKGASGNHSPVRQAEPVEEEEEKAEESDDDGTGGITGALAGVALQTSGKA